MNSINLILALIVMIPAAAIIDYFAFRKRIERSTGQPAKWYHFIIPCAIEVGCFIAGYIAGKGGI